MAPTVQQQWHFAQRIEKELLASLKEKDARIEDIERLIHELRIACEAAVFLDIDYATSQKVESHLWDAHVLINNRYRKIVSRYKTEEQKKLVVEKRKWEKRYVDFLKTSQFFYKGFVQRLASHYDIPELRKIAHRLQLDNVSASSQVKLLADSQNRILLSCYATLLRLGDLSRYRNVLRTKDRNFDVALAYYGLANDLCPDSGNAFNQMAVISLQEMDHLHAVYYLYRALAIKEPNTVARGNLTIEFRKILTEWTNGAKTIMSRSTPAVNKTHASSTPLVTWFVRLHAKLYKGEDFAEHDELENEVLSQLAVLLKEQPLEGIVDKFVLINIAAEFCAGERLKGRPLKQRAKCPEAEDSPTENGPNATEEHFQSYYFLLKMNVRMLFMLLQLLQPELAGPSRDDSIFDLSDHTTQGTTEAITAVTRRTLPALRQYSTWLVSRADIIVANNGSTSLNVHIKEMWSMYSSTLTMLVAAHPPTDLPTVDYLLEEDAATVGFKPFRDSALCSLYTNEQGLKARTTDAGVERSHPNVEMLARIRDLLKDGTMLAVDDRYPISLANGRFCFVEEGLPMSSPTNVPSSVRSIISPDVLEGASTSRAPTTTLLDTGNLRRAPSVAPSDSHQSMSTDMHRMVDDLLTPPSGAKQEISQGTGETSYGMTSLIGTAVNATPNTTDRPISRHQMTPLPFAFGERIWGSSPFSPQPGELSTTTTDHSMASVRLSDLQLSNKRQQFDAAAALEQSTGQKCGSRNGWGSMASGSAAQSPRPQMVGQLLQDSLAEQYGPSSMASGASSIYASSPYQVQQFGHPYGAPPHNTSVNESTGYRGNGFDTTAMLQSSLWNGSQPAYGGPIPTPPGGQGG
ncbi:MAG: hypothetical protein M1818_000268 [Claussenomyces sp. TS43310]|nr:MAG: hypothetical protein M1818_000268 [Claussenomyces sp. TS43310]